MTVQHYYGIAVAIFPISFFKLIFLKKKIKKGKERIGPDTNRLVGNNQASRSKLTFGLGFLCMQMSGGRNSACFSGFAAGQ